MKYAIVEISGRQFWIESGKYYDFNRIPTELGKQITLNRKNRKRAVTSLDMY